MCSDTIRQTIHRSLNKKTPQDRFFEESSFIQWFNEDVRKAGIKIITFHGLRHPYVKPKTKKYESFLCPIGQ